MVDALKESAPYLSFGDLKDSPRRAAQASRLYVLSIAYFMLPCLIYLVGFTKWYVILFAGLSLVVAGFIDAKYELSRNKVVCSWWGDMKWFLLIMLAACLWTSMFGAGFVGPQTNDQIKNHMIHRDLFVYSWPVIYHDSSPEMRFLSYPLGYYLVPALVGKAFGWTIDTLAIFLWTALGIALLWSWFCVLFSRFAIFAVFIFIFFSGLDILGMAALGHGTPAAGTHLEWWSGWTFLQYSSNATVMSWSTQHGAAQWLFPMLLFYRLFVLREVRGSTLLVSIAALWSHLTLLGAALFLPLYFKEKRISQLFKPLSLLPLPFLAVVAIFYASKAPGMIDTGFVWELWPISEFLPKLIWFNLFEFGILALIIFSIKSYWCEDERLLFIGTLVVLLVVPFYHIGWSNDVSMRVSAIPLFMLFVIFCTSIREAFLRKNKAAISVALLYMLVAMFTPMNEMFRQFYQIKHSAVFIDPLTDENWNRGVGRNSPNCFIIINSNVINEINPNVGDTVTIKGVGSFSVAESLVNGPYRNICVSPESTVITHRPAGSRSLTFSRNGLLLEGKTHFYAKSRPEEIRSIIKLWPQQYTGSMNSIFFKFFIDK